jgi:hypothetical protein
MDKLRLVIVQPGLREGDMPRRKREAAVQVPQPRETGKQMRYYLPPPPGMKDRLPREQSVQGWLTIDEGDGLKDYLSRHRGLDVSRLVRWLVTEAVALDRVPPSYADEEGLEAN